MLYGVCNLSIVPLRLEPNDTSELVSQVLYGEVFKILEQRKKWRKIRLAFDTYEGWIDHKQYKEISNKDYTSISEAKGVYNSDLVEFTQCKTTKQLYTIPLGATLNSLTVLNHTYDGNTITNHTKSDKTQLISTAYLYLNTAYLWGGKTPFGIDCSGFTQMVYMLNGYQLFRDASQQATQGEALSFIEESEPGDLAFFDNAEGLITHVGIIMENNHIIHAHGKVRIDRLDHTGIYNLENNSYTHKLRIIKKVI